MKPEANLQKQALICGLHYRIVKKKPRWMPVPDLERAVQHCFAGRAEAEHGDLSANHPVQIGAEGCPQDGNSAHQTRARPHPAPHMCQMVAVTCNQTGTETLSANPIHSHMQPEYPASREAYLGVKQCQAFSQDCCGLTNKDNAF